METTKKGAIVDESTFAALVEGTRKRDEGAASELVRRYEPVLRRVVRSRLRDPYLRRLLDSMDICQSVLGTFFVRAAAGEFDLSTPDRFLSLLATMARNKVIDKARGLGADMRNGRGNLGEEHLAEAPAPGDGPYRIVEEKEEEARLASILAELAPEDREMIESRSQDPNWEATALRFSMTVGAAKQKYYRLKALLKRRIEVGHGD